MCPLTTLIAEALDFLAGDRGRRVGRRHGPAAVGDDDRVRDGRRRGEAVAAVDPDLDAARHQDLPVPGV